MPFSLSCACPAVRARRFCLCPLRNRTSAADARASQSLHNKRVLSIDLSAIMAGSGIRGQFEEKFKALLRDIEAEVRLSPPSPSKRVSDALVCAHRRAT